MKKLYPRIAAAIAACALLLGITACGGDSSDSTTAETAGGTSTESSSSDQYTVGFSIPSGASPTFQIVLKGLEAYAADLGIEIVPIDAQLNMQKQVSDINQMVAQQMDGIIAYPLAPGTLDPALNEARAAGVKVLGYNAVVEKPAPDADLAPYDSNMDPGQAYQGAELLAKYVSEQLDGSAANVIGIGISAPVPAIKFTVEQYQTYLEKFAPQANWLDTVESPTDDISGTEKVVSQAITKHRGEIDAVMAYSDEAAVAAATAFKNASLPAPVAVGTAGDAVGVKGIEDGTISALVDLMPWRESLVLAQMMSNLLTEKEIPNWVPVPVEMYTKETIGERLDWNQALEEIEAGELTCQNGGCPASITSP